jgi:hypothetical protein
MLTRLTAKLVIFAVIQSATMELLAMNLALAALAKSGRVIAALLKL